MTFDWKWLGYFVFSLGGITFFFPLLAVVASWLKRSRPAEKKVLNHPIEIDILIPAFNEAETVERTLESIALACEFLKKSHPHFSTRIVLGLDGSTDQTAKLARAFEPRIELKERSVNQGKWKTLNELIEDSKGEWSALVDCGTLWPEDFLARLASRLESSNAVGIAPGYEQQSGGLLSRLIWWQERFLKSIENRAGGPISVHGATMIFRTKELKASLKDLGLEFKDRNWLNDDVVIAFRLRRTGSIDYLGDYLTVKDCGVKKGASELGRRKRILLGNIEWIRDLYFPEFSSLTVALALLALRRVMRILWAYFLIFSIFSLFMFFGGGWELSLGFTALLIAVASISRSFREAGWVSLSVPLLLLKKPRAQAWS